jgi:hypothetical protein
LIVRLHKNIAAAEVDFVGKDVALDDKIFIRPITEFALSVYTANPTIKPITEKPTGTLCQIVVVDEQNFTDHLRRNGSAAGFGAGGWGQFTGKVPAVNTSFEIDLSKEYEDRPSAIFRVLYHHRYLIDNGRIDHETLMAPLAATVLKSAFSIVFT